MRGAASPPERESLAPMMLDLLGPRGPEDLQSLEEGLREVLETTSDADIARFSDRIATTGTDWGYHPGDPLARRLGRVVLRVLLAPGSRLHNAAHLERATHEPVVLLGNHLSFVDANVFEHLASLADFGEVARRITVLVGPKVYAQPLRRLASLCFGTVKLPQSPSRASEEAVMPPREAARLATEAIRTARGRQLQGDHLLIFVEGSRSRTGEMQRSLAAVARYLETARWLVPFGLWGSERLQPLEGDGMHAARVEARIGLPLATDRLEELCRGKRPLMMDTVGCVIAELLPSEYRGVYGAPDPRLDEARGIALELGARSPEPEP